MYLFTRVRTAKASRFRDALAWATEARDFVTANTDLDLSLYGTMFGRPVGTLTWGAMVEGRATTAATTAQMMSNPDYLDLSERSGDLFVDNGHDYLRQIIQMDGMDPENVDPPPFTQGWSA